jgi:hypothetical protein
MTITAAWVRTLRDCKELIVVSDSRLNGGKKMDCGQKVIALPRSDAFICFAGDTGWAYPFMHQVANAISTYEKSASRAQDISELKSHVLKVFEGLRESVHDACGDEGIPSAEFLFGGYSWIQKEFLIWRIHFQVPKLRKLPKWGEKAAAKMIKERSKFIATPAKDWKGQPWIFAGNKEYVDQARLDLSKMMRSRKRLPDQVENFKFDWEPFEVIRDMLRKVESNPSEFKNGDIGGVPQVLKIYEHLSSRYLGIEWKKPGTEDKPDIFVCGRKTLGYETPTLWILNPDTLVSRHPFYTCKGAPQDETKEVVPEEA